MENFDTEGQLVSDFLNIFAFTSFTLVTLMLGYGTFSSIRNKFYPTGLLFGILFLLCLKALFDLIPSIMIDAVTLLQINATIIAGALILLTITSFVGKKEHEPIELPMGKTTKVALTPHQVASGCLVAFGGSSFLILINDSIKDAQVLSYYFSLFGFLFLIISGIIIAGKEQFDPFKRK